MPTQQAETLTRETLALILGVLDNVKAQYATEEMVSKDQLLQQARFDGLRNEVEATLLHHKNSISTDVEQLREESKRIRSEAAYNHDKLTAGQRLDLNLERGRMTDELRKVDDRINVLESKVEREIHLIRTHIESSKNDLLKYSVGTLTAFGAMGLGLLRLIL